MAEKPDMMRPERALALVGGRQERLGFLRRDQRQGAVHAWPGRGARGHGQSHRSLERGHHGTPFLLRGAETAIARGTREAGGCRTRPPGPGPARVWGEPRWLV